MAIGHFLWVLETRKIVKFAIQQKTSFQSSRAVIGVIFNPFDGLEHISRGKGDGAGRPHKTCQGMDEAPDGLQEWLDTG